MKTIVFATNNKNKLAEVRSMLNGEFEVVSLNDIGCHDDIPETADTIEGNALMKAEYIHSKYHIDCFADDTGLEVEALGGAPGVHSARYANPDHNDPEANIDKLLSELSDKTDRRARFRTCICVIKDNKKHLFEGAVSGHITQQRRGLAGFGYDPVFMPDGYTETFAQLGNAEKNKISHRARAVAKLAKFLLEK